MRKILQVYGLLLFMSISVGVASGQSTNYYKTHQSGDWNNSATWERYDGTVWNYPAVPPSAGTSNGILIAAGHEVGVAGGLAFSADQLKINGVLRIKSGAEFTIVDGPGIDLEVADHDAWLIVQGKLVNKGRIEINQGSMQAGTVENDGEIFIDGILQFRSGSIAGNFVRYGLSGTLVVTAPGYTIDPDDPIWPVENAPPNVNIESGVTLNGDRTVKNTLEISGDLDVAGTLTNNGTALVSGTLQLTGTLENNGITDISGKVELNNSDAAVKGNPLVYSGCCSQLEINGPGYYGIDNENLIWPEIAPPEVVTVPSAGRPSLTLTASRRAGRLELSSYATARIAGELTLDKGGNIDGQLLVDGTLINNGKVELGRCVASGTVVNNDTLIIGNFFQLETGGNATGKGFSYEYSSSKLVFNNYADLLEVDTTSAYWPASNGPGIVQIQGGGGVAVNVPRTVPSLFQLSAPVSNAGNLTLISSVQIDSGGVFDAPPIYTTNASLTYNIGGSYDAGPEWSGGSAVGPGVPKNVTVPLGTTLIMPDGARRCPGKLTLRGTLVLSTTPGADLSLGGDLENYGTLVPNSRQVILDGTSPQDLEGETTVDYLIINNPSGVSIPGGCGDAAKTDKVTVNQLLTFVTGNILVGNCFSGILVISQSAVGASKDSHVVTYGDGWVWGLVDRGESLTFPISIAAVIYNPLTVTSSASQEILFITQVSPVLTYPEGIVPAASLPIAWSVNPGCFSGELTFQWDGLIEGDNFTRNNAAVYRDGIELPSGMTAGTDPYTLSTTLEQACPYFAPAEFMVSNSQMSTPVSELITSRFFLDQNEPNPFRSSTLIRYSIPETGLVQLTVYDALGREMEKLVDERQAAGRHEREWRPSGLAGGLYFYRLRMGQKVTVKTLNLYP